MPAGKDTDDNASDFVLSASPSAGSGLLPALSISDAGMTEGNAGTATMVFAVSLSVASHEEVRVLCSTADGTATVADNDYVPQAGVELVFPPGTTTRTFGVAVNGDTVGEAEETLYVSLSGAVHATIADAQGEGSIRNDDPFTIQLKPGYNLVALPFTPRTPYTAEGLAVEINRLGAGCTAVLTYAASTGFQTHTTGAGGDFNILPGAGYFLLCENACDWVLGAE
jgi:hypothetical protein